MKLHQLTISATLLLACASLVGCGKSVNPLEKVDTDTAARFLQNTAMTASAKLHLSGPKDGSQFADCMDKKSNSQQECQRLYKEMANVAKASKQFNNVTVANITAPLLWRNIGGDYHRLVFNTIT